MSGARARLLQAMQDAFPLVSRPFQELGRTLDLNENEVIAWVQEGLTRGEIRRIGGIAISANLGYSSTLCAVRIPEERLPEAVELINAYPEVTHHYLRNHAYNVWFTLIAPSRARVLELEQEIGQGLGLSVLDLPAHEVYKVKADFTLDQAANSLSTVHSREKNDQPLSDREKKLIQLVQGSLPVQSYPFKEWCGQAGLEESEFLAGVQNLLDARRLRRFGAVLGHRKIGYTHNAMGLWPVTEESADLTGKLFAAYPEVSHCYLRGPFAGQPRWIFTMLHAKDEAEMDALWQRMVDASGITQGVRLLSLQEYKKTSMQYF